ncbi:hypothetical protein CRUP_016788 [Coryphaenoides rupestris]|nr:hypothetical protein CRUP_016788 [Coryphaenoides rupestris]
MLTPHGTSVKSALRLPRCSLGGRQGDGGMRPYRPGTRPFSADVLHVPFLDSLSSPSPPSPPSPSSSLQVEREWKQVVDILWSDPKPQEGCSPNTFRGGGCYYGPDVTRRLLMLHGYQLLIRSHECKQDGYEVCHGGHVITIFSASNYYEEGSNRGAYVKLGSDLEKLFSHRSELLTGFLQYDPHKTGSVPVSEWAQVLEGVLRLDLPWRTLRPHLARLDTDGSVDYLSCFDYMSPGLQLPQVSFGDVISFVVLDVSSAQILATRLISLDEFRHTWRLFSAHLGVAPDDGSVDDLARSMDFNKDGSIDFTEFLEAFRVVHKLDRRGPRPRQPAALQ